jgi:peptidoglycan hydrolase CwlO-like protein
MGEDAGTTSTTVTDSNDPEAIRHEIESTREELGDTVAALAEKVDVKAQARQKLESTKAAVTGKKDELVGKAKGASPETATTAAVQASQKARQNPVPVAAAGAFAFGFLAGWVMRR